MKKQHFRCLGSHTTEQKTPASTGSVLRCTGRSQSGLSRGVSQAFKGPGPAGHCLAYIYHCEAKRLSKACREEGGLFIGPGRVGNSFSMSVIKGLQRQTTSGSNDFWKRKYLYYITDETNGALPVPCCYLGVVCLPRVWDSSTTWGSSHIFLLFAQWDICLPNCCLWKFYMLPLLAEAKHWNKPSLFSQLLSEAICTGNLFHTLWPWPLEQ